MHGDNTLIDSYIAANPAKLARNELDIVASWRQRIRAKFFIIKYLNEYAVFLTGDDPPVAYGVVSLTDRLDEMLNSKLPIWVEAILLPFNDKIVHDGLISGHRISFGAGMRRGLDESFRAAKSRLGIVTSLPIGKQAAVAGEQTRKVPKSKQPAKSKPVKLNTATRSSDDGCEITDVITGLTQRFCLDHLNQDYANLCLELTIELARKQPSPLLKGNANAWASGIVRTIGWFNFLQDPSQTPHMKPQFIDQAFGVSESTGQAKSRVIRKLFDIIQLDPAWTLPSRIGDNPLIWMIEVDGLLVDIRHAPREIQEVALEQGIIPYIPGDRTTDKHADTKLRPEFHSSVDKSSQPSKTAALKIHSGAARDGESQLYKLEVLLIQGMVDAQFAKKNPVVMRAIQIRGDQTLEDLHFSLFQAFDRFDDHLYEFQFGKQPMAPNAPRYGLDMPDFGFGDDKPTGYVDRTTLDSLQLKVGNTFFYWFDFGDDWWHRIEVAAIEDKVPSGKFPKVTQRIGKSPPQYLDDDENE